MNKNKHVIDLIFPLSLFFVFISSCVIVLILSFHVYKETLDLEQVNYESRTALSYMYKKYIKMILLKRFLFVKKKRVMF